MSELEYLVGGLDFDFQLLRSDVSDGVLFVVAAKGISLSIYLADVENHRHIVSRYSLCEASVVGGGLCELDGKLLNIGLSSGKYGSVPDYVLKGFASLLIPEFIKAGMEIDDVLHHPSPSNLNRYWTSPHPQS